MENLLVYSAKSAAILSLFCLVYRLFLKRETFFVGHRFFLLFGGLTALFLPIFKHTKYVSYIPQTQSPLAISSGDMLMSLPSQTTTISWEILAIFTYVTVAIVLFIKLFLEMKALFRLYATSPRSTERGITKVLLTSPQSPFSFFNCIFFHPNTQDKSLSLMLAHEAVHVRQWHSIDVIFGRLISIFLWWFPLSWVYNNEIKQNLEFLADLGAIRKTASVKAYQNVLLETSLGFQHYPLSNYFHKSFLKTRIMMLKTSPSNRFKAWKYSLVFPALYLFVIHFNTKLVAQVAPPPQAVGVAQTPNPAPQLHLGHEQTDLKSPVFEINSETTEETLNNYKKKAAEKGYSLSFSKIKRNQAGKIIRIRIKYSRNNEETVFFVDGKTPIQPIKIGENRAGDLFVKQGKPKKAPHVMMKKRINKKKPHASHHGNYVFFSDSDNDSLTMYHWNDKEKPMHIEMEIDELTDSLSHGLNMFFSKNEHALDSLMTKAKFKIQSLDMDLDTLDLGNAIRIEALEDLAFEELDELVIHMDSIQPKIMKQMRLRKPRLTWIEEDDSAPLQVKTSGRLIFIDGKESTEEALGALNPDKIEKMEVLKGEMAKEKYGERGKEGVILITTKS